MGVPGSPHVVSHSCSSLVSTVRGRSACMRAMAVAVVVVEMVVVCVCVWLCG